jgi:hypothetical protein
VENIDGVVFIKPVGERATEPTEGAQYQFQRARAADIRTLLQTQLQSGLPPQIDERTNTIFYGEYKSNLERIERFLAYVDQDVATPKLPDEKDLSVPSREFHFQTWGDELLPWADDEQFAKKITPYEGEPLELNENSKSFEVGIKFTGYPSNSDFLYVQRGGKVTFCRRFPGKDRVDVEEFTIDEETMKPLRTAFKTSKVGSLDAAYFVESNSPLSCELRCTDGSRFRRMQFDDHFPLGLRVFVNEVIRLVIDGERPESVAKRVVSLKEAIEIERRFFPREHN